VVIPVVVDMYNEKYYKTNNYCNYLERKDRYKHLAKELGALFDSLSISKNSTILDYGCALGFLIDGFKSIGWNKVYGYEVSEYCINECWNRGIILLDQLDRKNDIIISLDVFEHMEDEEILDLFYKTTSDILVGRIPVKRSTQEEDFYLEVSKSDPTHINCKTKYEWKDLLRECGYSIFFHLNLFSIYDSDGVFSFIAFKGNL
jgi:hypothetical protein